MIRFIRKLIFTFLPQSNWLFIAIMLSGISIGFAAYAFYISRAWSYASDKPEACINCHVMTTEYVTWKHSSHRQMVCNDCHVPHDNFFKKYLFKANDGLRHATIFTLRLEDQATIMKEAGNKVVASNCFKCHQSLFASLTVNDPKKESKINSRACWDCHREVPHGSVKSLSSTSAIMVPLPGSPVPNWLNKLLNNN